MKVPSSKFQVPNKFPLPNAGTRRAALGLEFEFWSFLEFGIWSLEFSKC